MSPGTNYRSGVEQQARPALLMKALLVEVEDLLGVSSVKTVSRDSMIAGQIAGDADGGLVGSFLDSRGQFSHGRPFLLILV